MELNISAEDTQHPRAKHSPRASPVDNDRAQVQNDLNAPRRAESIYDNTEVAGYDASQNIPVHRRGRLRRQRRYTLSIIEKELEEAKRLIEAKTDLKLQGDNNSARQKTDTDGSKLLNENLDNRSSETETKTPYEPPEEIRHQRPGRRSDKVYARYVQEGERNLMLIYEPKESKSEVYCKQIGDKNIMVHLNVSSNLCQLIDRENKGIIPLDSEGEVWLEIRRRSQTINRTDMSDATSSSDNVFGEAFRYEKQHGNEYVVESFLTDSYVEGKIAGCQAAEHSYNANDLDEDEEEGPYNTISVQERGDSLMIKFEKWNQHGVLNSDNLQESPILTHKKVLDFLSDKGNNFDVSICDWDYEKEESVYSYISSNLQLVDMNEDYTEIPPAVQQFRPRAKEPEEHETSSFGTSFDHAYDSPMDVLPAENELYSRVVKNITENVPDCSHGALDISQRQGKRAKDEKEITRSQSEPDAKTSENSGESYHRKPHVRSSYHEDVQRKPEVPSRRPNLNLKQDLTVYKWYHGKIERKIAKERLKGKEHGSFLVRDASGGMNGAHRYTIEFIDGKVVKKLMIMNTNSKFHFKEYEDKKFDRVELLINTIMTNGLEVKDKASGQWKKFQVKPVSHA